ncbi:hypothetical protein C6P42_005388 [Pichia californica]|nr:hypothetical protein C6P42_005388 [[Candida] californica]
MEMMEMDNNENALATSTSASDLTPTVNWDSITPTPWAPMHHGAPILKTKLTLEQKKYWENYNTTTYLTLNSPYQSYLNVHLIFFILSSFIIYPFVLILNNLNSNWFLPISTAQLLISIISCISYSIFINNVPDLYPNMVYTKLIKGLFVFNILQWFFSLIYTIKNWLNPNNEFDSINNSSIESFKKGFQPINNRFSDTPDFSKQNNIQLDDFCSPSSTLFDDENADTDSFNLDNENNSNSDIINQGLGLGLNINNNFISNNNNITNQTSKLIQYRNKVLNLISKNNLLSNLATSFGLLFTVLHNLSIWLLFAYFFILFPTSLACLNLFGQGSRIFNLLAHFIKGGIFFLLGILSLSRYCGCFAGVGGAWNFAYIDLNYFKSNNSSISDIDRINSGMGGIGSGGSKINNSFWIKVHRLLIPSNLINQLGGLICSFEFAESCLIFTYGASNVFLEHLASTNGVWTAKDLQHVSIAFMYFGAGLCGIIAEFKLSSWRRSLFFNVAGNQLSIIENIPLDSSLTVDDQHHILGSKKLLTPGFSPNPFPVFTIFWTGLLMSKHAQPSSLSTAIHVQWGSLLTYGSFFRILTFILMSYYPLRGSKECFLPSKPLTELITSFCLLCGGMVFMESTDQVIEALAYRGLTPMFTINVSVGITSIIMAWIMFVLSMKDKIRARQQSMKNNIINTDNFTTTTATATTTTNNININK